jgi:hypothetical protein
MKSLDSKAWWKSITLWFNTVLGSFPFLVDIAMSQLPSIREFVPTNLYSLAFVVLTVGNVFIRVFMTKTALVGK